MEDNNNYQNNQNQVGGQADNTPPSTGQQNPEGNTYWEQNNTDQQHPSQQPFGEQPNDQQPQYSQPSPGPAYPGEGFPITPKKKSRGALIALVTILLLLCVGAGTAFAFKDTFINFVAKTTKSPVDYYAFIEKNTINAANEEISQYMDLYSQQSGKVVANEVTSDITLNKDSLNSLLQTSLGVTLTDLESQIGLSIDNIGFDAIVATDGNLVNESVKLSLNQVDLITTEIFYDIAAQKILLRFPELSDAYLSVSNEDTGTADMTAMKDLLTKERITDLLKRYSNIIIDNVNEVELGNNAELSVDTLTTKCTSLTVTITEEDVNNMALAVLEEAKEDEAIIELLPMFNLTKEEYQTYIDEAVTEVQTSLSEMSVDSVQMIVYVDGEGKIIGREFKNSAASTVVFGYTTLSEKNYDEYSLYVNDETGTNIFELKGTQTEDQGSYDGEATVVVSGTDEYSAAFSLNVSYNDLRTEKKNDMYYQYGSISLSSLDLMGLQVNMTFDVLEDVQTSQVVFQLGAEPLVTIDSKIKPLTDYELAALPADVEVYDVNQAESYMATMDIEGYISNLSDKLGVDLQSILNAFLYGATY